MNTRTVLLITCLVNIIFCRCVCRVDKFLRDTKFEMSTIALDTGLNLRELVTTGSVLHINEDHENVEHRIEPEYTREEKDDILGEPVSSLEELAKNMTTVDDDGYVKKNILEAGGGLLLNSGCTVSVAYSGYFEGSLSPFDMTKYNKPLVVNLEDTGLLPGLEIAIKSMLVGETSVFLLNYKLMYGELGIPPRIKPQTDCIFYIKLIKSILTPEGSIDVSEKNIFQRLHSEVKKLYTSGVVLHKAKNFTAAVQLFRKGVSSLHKCRLADEQEENVQQKLLIKLYLNLAVCYNKLKQPLKACISCNELNRLNSLWNNEKALYQNAKALRMISQFDAADKRLQRALKLSPHNEDIQAEIKLLEKLKYTCNRTKLLEKRTPTIGEDFKEEVEDLIKNFKENHNLCKLTLPGGLNDCEIEYIKSICERENLICNKVQKNYLLDKDIENLPVETDIDIFL